MKMLERRENYCFDVLPNSTVSAQEVRRFADALSRYQIGIYGISLRCGGQTVWSSRPEPFEPGQLYRAYSISKSFTAMAVGALAEEGKIGLDDPIVDYFPEYCPARPSLWLRSMTIRDLLSMRSCYRTTTYDRSADSNWVRSFFTFQPEHPPGTVFNYDTSAMHTLSALVEKISGQPMLDYLRGRCLNEIGFSKEAYFLKDPQGVSMGGSGLVCTLEDLELFGQLLVNGGVWNGRELLPAQFVKQALQPQSFPAAVRTTNAESYGYGYGVWCLPGGAFFCYGKGLQMVVALPHRNLILCAFGGETINRGAVDVFVTEALRCFGGTVLPERSECRMLYPLRGDKASRARKRKLYCADTFFRSFSLDDSAHTLEIETIAEKRTIRFAEQGFCQGEFPWNQCRYVASGGEEPGNAYCIRVLVTFPEPATVFFEITDNERGMVVVRMTNSGERMNTEYQGTYVCNTRRGPA